MKRRILLAALVAGTSFTVASQPAQAQIGTCPLITPAPCIIFDYKKMADWATTHAQDLQKLQQTVQQVREMQAQVQTIGQSIQSLPKLETAPIMANMSIPGKSYTNVDSAITSFAPIMFPGPGGADERDSATQDRVVALRAANAEAFAYGQQNCRMVQESRSRMRELHAAARASTDLRGDWSVNSQIRTELVRTTAQKNVLLAAYLEMQAVQLAAKVDPETPTEVTPRGSANAAPATPGRGPNAQNIINLFNVVNGVRQLLTNSGSVESSKGVIAGNDLTISQYEQTLAERNAALNNLRTRVNAWAREEGRNGQPVIDRVLAELNSMDASSAALRQQPVESLSRAFASRNIDAAKLMQNDVDPRQFLGTWTDPLKFQNTNAMSNNLAKNVFEKIFDRGGEREQFVELVYKYNDLRLQEAWMREYAAEARQNNELVNADIAKLNEEQGITISATTTSARLKELVAEANQLAQVINSTATPAEKEQAQEALDLIKKAIEDSALVASVEGPEIVIDPSTVPPATNPSFNPTNPTNPGNPKNSPTGPIVEQ